MTDVRQVRDPAARGADHAAIDRLADDLLPRLIGRLESSGFGELEVREDGWRVRLRRPAPAARTQDGRKGDARDGRHTDGRHDRPGDRPARAGAPHHGPGDPRPREWTDSTLVARTTGADGNGTGPGSAIPSPVRRELVATSPAVGVFQPRSDIRTGSRVRAGDRLGFVDLLGLPQDVVAPVDGVVTDTLVGAGEGVEYGQNLIVIEPVQSARPGSLPVGPGDGA